MSSRTLIPYVGAGVLIEALARESGDVVVWWYGPLSRNYRDASQPLVGLCIRSIEPDGSFGDVRMRMVAVTYMPLAPIGSVWRAGRRVADLQMEGQRFTVLFTGKPEFVSNGDAGRSPVPEADYPTRGDKERSPLMRFPSAGGRSLLLPSLELFFRGYARGAETIRVLATYPWHEALDRLSRLPVSPPSFNGWLISLGAKIPRADAPFVAAVRYDQVAAQAAQHVYAQLATAFGNKTELVFPNIFPWFHGPATLQVSGLWVDGGKSFLALRLDGMSMPEMPSIKVLRDVSDGEDPVDERAVKRWPRTVESLTDEVGLTNDDPPDENSAKFEIEADAFLIIGGKPSVTFEKRKRLGGASSWPPPPGEPTALSGGDAEGRDKGVGDARTRSPDVGESQGVLLDMWRAMVVLKRANPTVVDRVDWYTRAKGFCDQGIPLMIPLRCLSGKGRAFASQDGQSARGMLVMRIVIGGRQIFILEVERRPDATGKDDELCGLAFELDRGADLDRWLSRLAGEIPKVRGVVRKLTSLCPGAAAAFKHCHKNGVVRAPVAVANALSTMNIKI